MSAKSYRFTVGTIECIAVSDGTFTYPSSAFVANAPVERFDQELAGHIYADRVHEDFLGGVRSGVNGTPTFYIDGARYDGSYEADDLVAALEQAAQ